MIKNKKFKSHNIEMTLLLTVNSTPKFLAAKNKFCSGCTLAEQSPGNVFLFEKRAENF